MKASNPALILKSSMILMVDLKEYVGCYLKCEVIYFDLVTVFFLIVRKDNTTLQAGHILALSSRILK
jgi:hypothetical protein